MKSIFPFVSRLFIAMFFVLLSPAVYSQTSLLITISNLVQTAPNAFEYDAYVTNTGTTSVALRGYSWGLNLTPNFANGGIVTHTFIDRDSVFNNIPPVSSAVTLSLNHLRATTVIASMGNEVNLVAGVPYKIGRMNVGTTAACWLNNFNPFLPTAPFLPIQAVTAAGRTQCVVTAIVTPPGTSVAISGVGNPPSAGSLQAITTTLLPDPLGTSPFLLNCACAVNTSSSVSACSAFIWPVNGQTYNASGVYTHTLATIGACDTVYTLNLSVTPPSVTTFNQSACDSVVLNGQTYSATGTYTQLYQNAVGCDSFVVLNLTINSSTSTISINGCDSISVNGQTYTSTGVYLQNYTNVLGCDSTVMYDVTINPSTISSVSLSSCDSVTLNGQTYLVSGTYIQLLANSTGCDSTIVVNVVIVQASSSALTEVACDSYTLNGQTYALTGIYTQTLVNVDGCDSILTLSLTINNNSSSSMTQSACDTYTLNAQTYTASGVYTQVLTNAIGCDSVLTLSLTIPILNLNTTFSGITMTSASSIGQYQWINCIGNLPISGATNQSFTPTANGSYAVILTVSGCSDTSACRSVTTIGINETEQSGFSIYPNPTKGIVVIETLAKTHVIILNGIGEIILEKEIMTGKNEINLSHFANGMYVVKLRSGDKQWQEKIVKGE